MPTLSMFYGILVNIYAEKDGRHNWRGNTKREYDMNPRPMNVKPLDGYKLFITFQNNEKKSLLCRRFYHCQSTSP